MEEKVFTIKCKALGNRESTKEEKERLSTETTEIAIKQSGSSIQQKDQTNRRNCPCKKHRWDDKSWIWSSFMKVIRNTLSLSSSRCHMKIKNSQQGANITILCFVLSTIMIFSIRSCKNKQLKQSPPSIMQHHEMLSDLRRATDRRRSPCQYQL